MRSKSPFLRTQTRPAVEFVSVEEGLRPLSSRRTVACLSLRTPLPRRFMARFREVGCLVLFFKGVFDWNFRIEPQSFVLLRGWAVGVVFLCQFIHLDARLLSPANFELRITIYCISLETIVNSIKILFDTSLPRVEGQEMLFLCVSFAVPSTTRSSLSDDVVRD